MAKFDPDHLDRLYATEDVVRQRQRTNDALDLYPGDSFLDVGCGPGYLTCEVAETVGEDGHVVGLDLSERLLEVARERAHQTGVADRAEFHRADAVDLVAGDASFDAAAAVQVLEYVPDVSRAVGELHRVLRPGGRLVVVDTDWRSCVWNSDDRQRTDDVLRRWEEHFVHPHLPTELVGLLRDAGFEDPEVEVIPLLNVNPGAEAYSLRMLDTIAHFVGRSAPDLAAAWRDDVERQARRGTYFFSLCRFQITASRPD